MEDFFYGIWSFFQGRGHLRKELDTSRRALEETKTKLAGLQKLTTDLACKMNVLTKQIEEIEATHQKRTNEYQQLIENLRDRIKEKDKTIQELSSQQKNHITK